MKQDASLRAILLQPSWVIVALCFEWNRAQVGGATASIRAIAGAASGRSVGFGACLTVEAVSLPCF
jgi:hypothetical protein